MKVLTWQLCGSFAFIPILSYASLLFFCFPQLLWPLPSDCLRVSTVRLSLWTVFLHFLLKRAFCPRDRQMSCTRRS